jgi:hypothetical protein
MGEREQIQQSWITDVQVYLPLKDSQVHLSVRAQQIYHLVLIKNR